MPIMRFYKYFGLFMTLFLLFLTMIQLWRISDISAIHKVQMNDEVPSTLRWANVGERKKLICEKNCFILISDSNECHFCVQDSRNSRNVEKFA